MLREILLIALATCVFGANAQQPTTVYEQPRDPQLLETYRAWKDGQLLERLRTDVLRRFNVENTLSLSIRNCGQANAAYRSDVKEVAICWELFEPLLASSLRRFGKDKSAVVHAVTSTFVFILYHELGHAFVDILKPATFGRGEDNADQIATLLLLEDNKRRNHAESNIGVLAVFDFWRSNSSTYLSKHQLAGPHSLSQQRAFNVICWAIGSDPTSRYKYLPQMTDFPVERIGSCVEEFQRAREALKQLTESTSGPR